MFFGIYFYDTVMQWKRLIYQYFKKVFENIFIFAAIGLSAIVKVYFQIKARNKNYE